MIEMICGSMFSGKSEELIRRVIRSIIARKKVQVFKPSNDTRYHSGHVTSHNGREIEAVPVSPETPEDILTLVDDDTDVVAIDEVQFFEAGVVDVVRALSKEGRRVLVAGLDQDFRGEPFGTVPTLLALAEKVDKLQAICVVCGEPASRTQRIIDGRPANYTDAIIMVGAEEKYEARCSKCHKVG